MLCPGRNAVKFTLPQRFTTREHKHMSVLSGIVDIAKNVGNAALAPVKGLGKMVATGLETNLF